MARDLHDEVNQALTAMLLRLEALAQDVPPEQREDVAQLKRLATQAMDELLNLARQLRPTALDDHGLRDRHRGPGARLRRPHRHRGPPGDRRRPGRRWTTSARP